MSQLMADWRAKKAREEAELHGQLRTAVLARQVEIYTDQRMLDFQGSPLHNPWDHIAPLLGLMLLALAILLGTGVAFGIVAMTIGVLIHLLGIKHFIAWRIRERTRAYMLESVAHWNYVWHLGGVALFIPGGTEPPCMAPRSDWRKFVRRTLFDTAHPAPAEVETPPEAEAPPEQEVLPP